MVLVAAAVAPTFRTLPVPDWVAVHRILDVHVDRFMPALTGLAAVAGTVAAVSSRSMPIRIGLLLGVTSEVVVAGISQGFNAPLNRQVRGWEPLTSPPGAHAVLSSWTRIHRFRTAAGVLALLCFAAGASLE